MGQGEVGRGNVLSPAKQGVESDGASDDGCVSSACVVGFRGVRRSRRQEGEKGVDDIAVVRKGVDDKLKACRGEIVCHSFRAQRVASAPLKEKILCRTKPYGCLTAITTQLRRHAAVPYTVPSNLGYNPRWHRCRDRQTVPYNPSYTARCTALVVTSMQMGPGWAG